MVLQLGEIIKGKVGKKNSTACVTLWDDPKSSNAQAADFQSAKNYELEIS